MPADGTTPSPTSFATEALLNDNRSAPLSPALAPYIGAEVGRESARYSAHLREAANRRGLDIEGEPFVARTGDQMLAAAEAAMRSVDAIRAAPAGKAHTALASAQRICRLNGWVEAHAALDAVGAALSRGDATAERAVEAAQVRLAGLPEGDAKVAVLLLATELLVLVREVA